MNNAQLDIVLEYINEGTINNVLFEKVNLKNKIINIFRKKTKKTSNKNNINRNPQVTE